MATPEEMFPAGCTLEPFEREVLIAEFERRNICSGFGATAMKLPDDSMLTRWRAKLLDCEACDAGVSDKACHLADSILYLVSEMENEHHDDA